MEGGGTQLWRPEPEEGTGFVECQKRPFPRPVPVLLDLLRGLWNESRWYHDVKIVRLRYT